MGAFVGVCVVKSSPSDLVSMIIILLVLVVSCVPLMFANLSARYCEFFGCEISNSVSENSSKIKGPFLILPGRYTLTCNC